MVGIREYFKKRFTTTANPVYSNNQSDANSDFDYVDIGGVVAPYNNETTWLELYKNEPYIKGIIDAIVNAISGDWMIDTVNKKPSKAELKELEGVRNDLSDPRMSLNTKIRTLAYKYVIDTLMYAETSYIDKNFYVLNSENCKLKWDKEKKRIIGITWSKDNRKFITLEKGEFVFASLFDPDTSLFKATSLETATDLANLLWFSRKYNTDIFKTGGVPSYMVVLGSDAPNTAVTKLKKLIKNVRAGQHIITSGDVKLLKLAGFTKDMEYDKLIDYAVRSLMTLFNITPLMMSYTGGSAGEAARQEMNSFATNIHSKQKDISSFITEVIHNLYPKSRYVKNFRWSLKKWVDVRQQSAIHKIYLDSTVLTPNEVRAELGREPVEWGDEPLGKGLQMGNTGADNPNGQNRDEQSDGNAHESDSASGESDTQAAERR